MAETDSMVSDDTGGVSLDPTGYYNEDETTVYDELYTDDETEVAGEDVYGVSRVLPETSGIVDPYELTYGKGTKVLGLPMYYTPLADPFNRNFSKMFDEDTPIVFLNPGKPKLNKRIKGVAESEGAGSVILTSILTSVKNYNDVRFMGFKQDWYDYYKYAYALMSYVYTNMSIDDSAFIFDFDDEYKKQKGTYGLAFFANQATQINETMTSSYGQSELASNASQQSQKSRDEARYNSMVGGGLGTMINNIKKSFESITEDLPIIGKLVEPMAKLLSGSQLYYPNVWSDSQYAKNYTLSFKFYSPYGDKESIFRYVYIPFLSLMALAAPKQDGIYAYKEPFLVRACCPGFFECECGVITSFDFKRGGEESLWTVEGLCNEIEVNMTIEDLYPNMPIPKNSKYIKFNGGLISFLECMAGMRMDQVNLLTRLKGKVSRTLGNGIVTFKSIKNAGGDIWYGVMDKMRNNFLR